MTSGRFHIPCVGQRFGRLVVLDDSGRTGNRVVLCLCRCDCGSEKIVRLTKLRTGSTRPCGCLSRELVVARNTTHGLRNHPLYPAWFQMRQRCSNKNNERWIDYGGRGIRVCARWNSFENFLSDMGQKPTAKHSLDRIDVDGDYEPSNCRWSTASEQMAGRRSKEKLKADRAKF